MNWPLPIRLLLVPLSWVYGCFVRCKTLLYASGIFSRKRLRGAVISVGNLTVGGTGKTPMVLWLAEKFLADGKRVAILSRGYRGSGGTSDEIEVLKARLGERVCFGVGADRYAEGRRIESERPVDVFLLDDGFQHLQLIRDVDIVLFDSTRPVRKEWLLPAGRLREPVSAVSRTDVVIFTRVQQAPFVPPAIQKFPKFPIYPATTKLRGFRRVFTGPGTSVALELSLPQPVFAFCGLGNPEAFFRDLERWQIQAVGKKVFRDHHRYTWGNLRNLEEAAETSGARALVTTQKDAQNIDKSRLCSLPIYYCEIALDIADENQVWRVINDLLLKRRGSAL